MTKTVTVYKEVHEKLKKHCDHEGYKMTYVASLAIAEYLSREEKEKEVK